MKKFFGIVLSIIVFAILASANVINVPDNEPTIQQGLNIANEGDTVMVAHGTYTENIFWPVTNGIVLLSEAGAETTIIDGSNSTNSVIYMYGVSIDTTTIIDGFTLQNGDADAGGGIACLSASPLIRNCIIENNEGSGCAFIMF